MKTRKSPRLSRSEMRGFYTRSIVNALANNGPMWELGVDTKPRRVCAPAEDMPQHCRVVPARQVGMVRHWMDVALFGPVGARGQEVAA